MKRSKYRYDPFCIKSREENIADLRRELRRLQSFRRREIFIYRFLAFMGIVARCILVLLIAVALASFACVFMEGIFSLTDKLQ